ncbi:MAG: tetratricopeptide repeat protein [Candidatus Syntrophosphaera sp.]
MIRYIPAFILQNYERGIMQGEITGFILHFDLIGFTRTCSELQKVGKSGAEAVGTVMESLMRVTLQNLETHCGFIFCYAGDAFYAIFPVEDARHVLAATLANREHMRENGVFSFPFGELRTKARQSVCYGSLNWKIYSAELKNEYVFQGAVLDKVHKLSQKDRELVFCKYSAEKVGMQFFHKTGQDYEPICKTFDLPACRPDREFKLETARSFVNSNLLDVEPETEIRPVTCCFVNIEPRPETELGKTLQTLEVLAVTYGGYVNNLVNTGSVFQAVVLYGMPRTEGNSMQRACRFALKVVKTLPRASLGISFGNVLAIYVKGPHLSEYTALGSTMNLAARLASRARPGEILTEAIFKKELGNDYVFVSRGTTKLKGISAPVRYFKLAEAFSSDFTGDRGSFVGRKPEMQRLQEWIKHSLSGRDKRIMYIYGEAGIGKTRLVSELVRSFSADECTKYRLYCDMLPTKTLEPVKQLICSLLGINITNTDEKAVEEFRGQWKAWAGKDKKLVQTESLIGALLGYFWEGSYWDILAPVVRLSEMIKAWQLMVAKMAKKKPLLIHLDDIQWIDPQTRRFLQALKWEKIRGLCIVATSRYLEDGAKPDLELEDFTTHRMDLKPLAMPERVKLMKSLLRLAKLPPPTLKIIKQRSSGNPFYIEQFISWVLENKKINARGEFLFDPDIEPFSRRLLRLNEIIISRIDRLTQKVRECVENASVLGMKFNIKVLSGMLNSDPRGDLENGIQNRIWKDLDEVYFIFSHWLIRDAIYERMVSDKLQKLHLAAAEAMERVYELKLDPQGEEIALHFEKAGQLYKAAQYYDMASNYNWDQMYLERSVANMTKAIALCEEATGKENMVYGEMLFHLAILYHYLLRMGEAEPLYHEVLRLAEREFGEDSPKLSPYVNNLGRFYKDTGRFRQGEEYLRRSLEIEKKLSPGSSNVADRINNIGHLYSLMNEWDKAIEMFREALDIVDRNYPPDFWFTAVCAGNLGKMYIESGRLEEAEPLLNRAHEIAASNWGTEHVSTALYLKRLGDLYLVKGDHQKAEEVYNKALAIYSRSFGKTHPRTKPILMALEKLHAQTGQ